MLFGLNSTMVRLKLDTNGTIVSDPQMSQFHYGSIKTIHIKQMLLLPIKCLNSTMVRLKLVQYKVYHPWIEESSQFHYGSIKTKTDTGYEVINARVSIPLWFD